ncbi:unnamed protein product [Leuciscus chuanchicus]
MAALLRASGSGATAAILYLSQALCRYRTVCRRNEVTWKRREENLIHSEAKACQLKERNEQTEEMTVIIANEIKTARGHATVSNPLRTPLYYCCLSGYVGIKWSQRERDEIKRETGQLKALAYAITHAPRTLQHNYPPPDTNELGPATCSKLITAQHGPPPIKTMTAFVPVPPPTNRHCPQS